jgi:tRNA(Ile)-lysidine synthase
MDVAAAVVASLQQHGVGKQEKLLLAVSGGMDSMVLWHVLHHLGQHYSVAHANFQLRGDAANADEALVQAQAQHWNIICHSQRFDTKAYAAAQGVSIQMAARDLRYQWFDKLCEELGYVAIVTAHHVQDRVETLLWNLLRTRGQAVWEDLPAQAGNRIRPLLAVDKAAIMAYASTHQVPYREDSSNASDAYARNYIRHHLLPHLAALNPSYQAQLIAKAERGMLVEQVLHRQVIAPLLTQLADDTHFLLNGWPDAAVRALALDTWLWQQGMPDGLRTEVAALLNVQKGTQVPWEAKQTTFLREVDRIVCYGSSEPKLPQAAYIPSLPAIINWGGYRFELAQVKVPYATQLRKDATLGIHYLAADSRLVPLPWQIRPWQAGDKVRLVGAPYSRKVSDWLTDAKVSHRQRAQHFVLTDANGHILFVQGLRVAAAVAVSDETLAVVRLSVRPLAP